jgi:hypothetical protein
MVWGSTSRKEWGEYCASSEGWSCCVIVQVCFGVLFDSWGCETAQCAAPVMFFAHLKANLWAQPTAAHQPAGPWGTSSEESYMLEEKGVGVPVPGLMNTWMPDQGAMRGGYMREKP